MTGGTAVPGDVLRHLGHAFELLRFHPWKAGPKTAGAESLRALLEAHPAALRSSEHHRILAKTAATWGEHVGALRRSVDLDSGNLQARCDLARALAVTGERVAAAALYLDLTSAEAAPCNAGAMLRKLEELAMQGTNGPIASPEDPVESVLQHL